MTDASQIGQPQTVVIDGQTYRLRPWDYADAAAWGFRLFSLLTSGTRAGSVASLLSGLDDAMWRDFCDLVLKYTDVVGTDAKTGAETVQQLKSIAAVHMRGRLGLLVELVGRHTAIEFQDFFVRAASALAAAVGKQQVETK